MNSQLHHKKCKRKDETVGAYLHKNGVIIDDNIHEYISKSVLLEPEIHYQVEKDCNHILVITLRPT